MFVFKMSRFPFHPKLFIINLQAKIRNGRPYSDRGGVQMIVHMKADYHEKDLSFSL